VAGLADMAVQKTKKLCSVDEIHSQTYLAG